MYKIEAGNCKDFKIFVSHCNKRIYFVTRLKSNAKYKVVEIKDMLKYKNISSDQTTRVYRLLFKKEMSSSIKENTV